MDAAESMALRVLLRNSRLLDIQMKKEKENDDDEKAGVMKTPSGPMDRFWKDQWPWASQLNADNWLWEDAHLNEEEEKKSLPSHTNCYGYHYRNGHRDCCQYSPSEASESSSSLCTQESSSFSSRSELLHSPDYIGTTPTRDFSIVKEGGFPGKRIIQSLFQAELSEQCACEHDDDKVFTACWRDDGSYMEFEHIADANSHAGLDELKSDDNVCKRALPLQQKIQSPEQDIQSPGQTDQPLEHESRGGPHEDFSSDSESWASASCQELLPDEEIDLNQHTALIQGSLRLPEPHRNGGCYSSVDEDFVNISSRLSNLALQGHVKGVSSKAHTEAAELNFISKQGNADAGLLNAEAAHGREVIRQDEAGCHDVEQWEPKKGFHDHSSSTGCSALGCRLSTPLISGKRPPSLVKGVLRFSEQGGLPCYSFSLRASDEVLFARAYRPKKQKKHVHWVYSFHSRRDSGKAKKKASSNKDIFAANLLGKMTVYAATSIPCPSANIDGRAIDCACEMHFVLRCQREVQILSGNGNGGAAKVQGKEALKSMDLSFNARSGRSEDAFSVRSHKQEGVKDSPIVPAERRIMKIELAAIVISTRTKALAPPRQHEQQAHMLGWGAKFLSPKGGWGMGFLDKSSDNARAKQSHSVQQIHASEYEQRNRSKPKHMQMMVDVTVILPAGDHGFPFDGRNDFVDLPKNNGHEAAGFVRDDDNDKGDGNALPCGPTPLIQRWLSGGKCDCGGWDTGCGLSVLKSENLELPDRSTSITLTNYDLVKWLTPGKPLNILSQGHDSSAFVSLEVMEMGVFSLSFRPCLSPLQALATAVAILHQQVVPK